MHKTNDFGFAPPIKHTLPRSMIEFNDLAVCDAELEQSRVLFEHVAVINYLLGGALWPPFQMGRGSKSQL